MELQSARRRKGESPQDFADRYRSLAQKTVVHYDQAEKMLLASFSSELIGTPGIQVRYARPASLSEAFQIAITFKQAELQKRRNESLYVKSEKASSQDGGRKNAPQRTHECRNCTRAEAERTQRSSGDTTRKVQPSKNFKRYGCGGEGHSARKCPNRRNRAEKFQKFTLSKHTPPKKTHSNGKGKTQGNA